MFLRNPRFMGLKFPDMSKPETLEKRYVGKMPKRASGVVELVGCVFARILVGRWGSGA